MNSQSSKTVQVFDLLWNLLQKCESMKHVDSIHENEDTHSCCMNCDRSFAHKCGLKHILKKFMRLEQSHKRAKAQVAKRVDQKKMVQTTTQW